MTKDTNIFLSHIEDLIASVKRGRKFSFSMFLNEEQQSFVFNHAKKSGVCFSLYGGYDFAQRCIAGFSLGEKPDDYVFPITVLSFDIGGRVSIAHRDVLGSLMALGIKRECIGDILFSTNKCYIFVQSKIADYILSNLFTVSSYHIDLCIHEGDLDFERSFEERFCIVSSMRLDCIISELASLSRTRSAQIIEDGAVFINGEQCLKKDKTVLVGNVISIRHIGKFIISSEDGLTKKNRIKLKILMYI